MSNAVCHYCHKQSADPVESEWDLIFQCWVCDDCLARVKREYPKGGWLYIVAINDQLIRQLRRTNRALGALSEQARDLEERWAKRDKRAA